MIDQLKTAFEAKQQVQRDRLLTIHDVMEKTRMGRSYIYNEMADGRIKPIKMGRVNRFVESEIDQWILDRIASR